VRRYVTALGVGAQSSRRKDPYRRLIWSIGARFSTCLSSSLICCVRSAGVHMAPAPATIVMLSGDVRRMYLAKTWFPRSAEIRSEI
jgi:hypothetical protein